MDEGPRFRLDAYLQAVDRLTVLASSLHTAVEAAEAEEEAQAKAEAAAERRRGVRAGSAGGGGGGRVGKGSTKGVMPAVRGGREKERGNEGSVVASSGQKVGPSLTSQHSLKMDLMTAWSGNVDEEERGGEEWEGEVGDGEDEGEEEEEADVWAMRDAVERCLERAIWQLEEEFSATLSKKRWVGCLGQCPVSCAFL